MSKYVFPAVFELEDGLYNVLFPDLPGCYTCGNDLADALYMAEDALAGWLSHAEEKGESIPRPSALNGIPQQKNTTFRSFLPIHRHGGARIPKRP